MPFAWVVECKTCTLRFAVRPRALDPDQKGHPVVPPNVKGGRFECPHCHEFHDYSTEEFIPGEGRIQS